MSRAARTMELADRLRASAETTVAILAAQLGVSERTVRRDLALLRERGMPVTGEPGPGGGIRLEGPRGVTAVHLTVGEVVALWLAARLAGAAAELPWSRRADGALAKLLGSLPRSRARQLRELCERVYVGPPASADVRAGAGSPELLRLFEEALSGGFGLAFAYVDRAGVRTRRRIEPHGLLVQVPVWYLLARDVEKDAPRAFRMDRITEPTLVRAHRFVPDVAVVHALMDAGATWQPLLAPPAAAR